MTVRNLDPAVKAKLKERAARHGRSMESEARAILTTAVEEPEESLGIADSIRRHFGDCPVSLPSRDHGGETQRPIAFD